LNSGLPATVVGLVEYNHHLTVSDSLHSLIVVQVVLSDESLYHRDSMACLRLDVNLISISAGRCNNDCPNLIYSNTKGSRSVSEALR
jgi:hypothetical protein